MLTIYRAHFFGTSFSNRSLTTLRPRKLFVARAFETVYKDLFREGEGKIFFREREGAASVFPFHACAVTEHAFLTFLCFRKKSSKPWETSPVRNNILLCFVLVQVIDNRAFENIWTDSIGLAMGSVSWRLLCFSSPLWLEVFFNFVHDIITC